MAIATFPDRERRTAKITQMPRTAKVNWVEVAACGSLIAGGLLLLTRQKRAGLVMAVSGTALAMLEHEETFRNLWNSLPSHVERAQYMFDQVQGVLESLTDKGETLRRVLSREPKTTIPA